MAVYVDRPAHNYGRMIMCHMIADTLEELHEMAAAIGIARKWFQETASFPHYDICKSKRAAAVKEGAIELNRRDFVYMLRSIRKRMIQEKVI
jgi:hypothetical protein